MKRAKNKQKGRKAKKDVNIVEQAYEQAIDTLRKCSTRHGLYASDGPHGYRGVWSRDSFITFLGASLLNPKHDDGELFRKTYERSLVILGRNQSKKGQIPNAVHGFTRKKPVVNYGSIDSTLWYIIGHYLYKKRYHTSALLRKYRRSISNAMTWLNYQDFGENIMLEQLPTTDWQDAFPERYGHTINTQALYYKALNLLGKKAKARKLRVLVNRRKETRLWNGNFYYSYRWKNHNKYLEVGDWFDSLGNLLAIIFGLAGRSFSDKILDHIQKKRINRPYPVKAIFPPITKKSEYWEDYYKDCDAGHPYHYLNGGIWTYIGGFYVLALIKTGQREKAGRELKLLAEANLRKNPFPEWVNPLSKRVFGIHQAWSAGTFMLAKKSMDSGRILI
jgi:glycogen debranching enzyme